MRWTALAGASAILAGCATQPLNQTTVLTIGPPTRVVAAPDAPIATLVSVPAGSELIYVSGTVPDPLDQSSPQGSVARFGDTEAQTLSVLRKIDLVLRRQGLTLGDVVMMRVFLVAPPGERRMDFAGMMRGYRTLFGTAQQPNKPARSTMEVSGLVDPGWLVEIEVTAARPGRRS